MSPNSTPDAVTPTVGVSGDDGGYCITTDTVNGYDSVFLMLNGNAWVHNWDFISGGEANGGDTVAAAYTFPSVTLQPGQSRDMSFAVKIQGVCHTSPSDPQIPAFTEPFFLDSFVDGTTPTLTPGPCWVQGILNTPTCPSIWPRAYVPPFPRYTGFNDVDSQQVARSVRISDTYWGPPPIVLQDGCIYNVLACSTGTPTCKSATPEISFFPGCPNYIHARYLVVGGTCDFAVATSATGPGPCN